MHDGRSGLVGGDSQSVDNADRYSCLGQGNAALRPTGPAPTMNTSVFLLIVFPELPMMENSARESEAKSCCPEIGAGDLIWLIGSAK